MIRPPRGRHQLSGRAVGPALALLLLAPGVQAQQDVAWAHWGGDSGGMRYSELEQITPQNVDRLEVLWTWRHGDMSDGSPPFETTSAFQLTPLLVEDTRD